MKILSLSVQHGGGSRAQPLLDWIFNQDPDVAVIPEWRDNADGKRILNRFQAEGFVTATASRPVATANGVLDRRQPTLERLRDSQRRTHLGHHRGVRR